VAKTAIFYLYASISRKRYEIQPKLPLMTHRKSDVRFRLAPRSMTLDDLEMENNLFSSFRRQYLVNSIHRCRTLTSASGRLSWLHSFSNLDRCRSIRVKCFAFLIKSRSAPTHLRKIRLSHAHLCCRRSLFTFKKRAWSAVLCADENKMTTPTTTRKICAFFFTGLDRSHLTNLDRSRFEKERNPC